MRWPALVDTLVKRSGWEEKTVFQKLGYPAELVCICLRDLSIPTPLADEAGRPWKKRVCAASLVGATLLGLFFVDQVPI